MDTIIKLMRKYSSYPLVRSLLSGVVAVAFQTAIFEILTFFLKLSASTATVIGAEGGLLFNFTLNHHFSFKGTHEPGSIWVRLLRYHAVVSGSIFIQWISLFITEHLTNNWIIIHAIYFLSIVVGFFWNYTWYRLWVWKHSHEGQNSTSA